MTSLPNLAIDTLGEATIESPLGLSTRPNDCVADYTADDATLPVDPIEHPAGPGFQLAGPRQRVFFRGDRVVAGIVTCGGLCPGMNNVIRGLVNTMWRHYGVRRIYGFRYGFRGMVPQTPDPPIALTPQIVQDIHLKGGSCLGSSRGPQDVGQMANTLQQMGINTLFSIGGDGTMRGNMALYEELRTRGAKVALIGVPKTIDNDIPFIERTFGFETAVSVATQAIQAAHVEAVSAPRGLGIVRLMGRHSGFIAATASTAARVVDAVLIPELPFKLEGEHGLLRYLAQRIAEKGYCVMVAAEGAGQDLLTGGDAGVATDPSGNKKLRDIGVYLYDQCKANLDIPDLTIKYIDPSYIIRATPTVPGDALFCGNLAQDAVHAAMAGKTGMMVGLWLNRATHVPLTAVTARQKVISLDSNFWRNVIDVTGQPLFFDSDPQCGCNGN